MDTNAIEGIASFLAEVIASRKPRVDVTLPTVEDLRAQVSEIYESASQETQGELESAEVVTPAPSEQATGIATGCVPCSIGHLGTCSGLLNEAMRFARKDGVESDEVINRANMCLDELNALERVDLRPELIVGLPDWEKTLAEKALDLSRSLRHDLEGLSTVQELEAVAARTQGTRQEIGSGWFRERLSRMTPEQKVIVERKIQERLGQNPPQEGAAETEE